MTAQSALDQIRSERSRNHTTRRFVGESVLSHRRRIGLVGVPVVRPNIPSRIECLGAAFLCFIIGALCLWGIIQ